MKTHEARRKIIRGWMAPAKNKRETEEQMQRIVNAFFFGVAIFSVAFAYFVLSVRAQISILVPSTPNSIRFSTDLSPSETSFFPGHSTDTQRASHGQGR